MATVNGQTILWALKMNLKLGNTTITESNAVLSTTSKYIMLDSDAFTEWKNEIVKANSTIDCSSSDFCGSKDYSCSELNSTLPELVIEIDGSFQYTLPSIAWSKKGFDGEGSGCTLLVQEEEQSNESKGYSVILGLIFIKQFTLTLNTGDSKIQIAPSLFSADGITASKISVKPDDPDKPDNSD